MARRNTAIAEIRQQRGAESTPFVSYAEQRTGAPRFHIRKVEAAQAIYPAHKHDYFQILYYATDAPPVRISLASAKPQPGSIYFIAPMTPHQVRFDAATQCTVLYFDVSFLRPNLSRSNPIDELVRRAPELLPFCLFDGAGVRLTGETRNRIERSLETMFLHHQSGRLCSTEIARAELTLMLSGICQEREADCARYLQEIPAAGRSRQYLRRLTDYIGATYTGNPMLAEAVAVTGLSRTRLCSLIREQTGSTFTGLITEMRIEDACERLTLTDAPISEIAHLVGYNDDKYFFRAFKTWTGMTPTEYRTRSPSTTKPAPRQQPT